MAIASDVVSSFVEPLETFINQGVSNLAGALQGPLTVGATLYIVIFGIMILLGYVRAPISDFVINVIKISAIVALVTQVDNYNYYVTDFFFTQLPEGLSSALGAVPGSDTSAEAISNGSAFDAVIDQAIAVSNEISEQGNWRNWYPMIVSVVFSVAALIVTMILLAIFLFAKVATALILVLGPIFIALLLFRVTQPFFSSWLAAVANFVLLQVLTVALITLLVTLITDYLDQTAGQSLGMQVVMAWRVIGLFALSLYLGLNLPDIAARISGGGLALGGGLASAALRSIAGRNPAAAAAAARFARSGGSMTRG